MNFKQTIILLVAAAATPCFAQDTFSADITLHNDCALSNTGNWDYFLRESVQANRNEDVNTALTCGANPNAPNPYGSTPLHYAARDGHVEIVKLLLEYQANPNTANPYDSTPLYRAVWNGHLEIVKLLLEYQADPNAANEYGSTPLYRAARDGHVEIARILMEHTVSFSTWSTYLLEDAMLAMIIQEYGNRDWTPLIEVFEARTGQRRVSVSTYKNRIQTPEEIREQIEGKIVIGVVTTRGLSFNGLMQIGEKFMKENSDFLIFYATKEIIDGLGISAFHGLIFPGAGDSHPNNKEWFTLQDMPQANRTEIEILYQEIYELAKAHNIPTLGICAGAQHLVLHRGGALMKKKDYNNDIAIQPFNPIHYWMLTETERQQTLDSCETPEIKINVMRAHTYAAEPSMLGKGIHLASIDGKTPMALYETFTEIAVQFHPESRYNRVSSYGDDNSNMRQTQFLNSFFGLCQEHKAFIEEALSANQAREEGIAKRDAMYAKISQRLEECKALNGL